jgi:uncharacterized protein (TIGR00725 family)
MEAVCKGAKKIGGTTIGIMPGSDKSESPPNTYIDIPIFTGMTDARNAINAKSSEIVIAIAGSFGTLSEIGLALKCGKKVIALDSWVISRKNRIPEDYYAVFSAEEAVDFAFKLLNKRG